MVENALEAQPISGDIGVGPMEVVRGDPVVEADADYIDMVANLGPRSPVVECDVNPSTTPPLSPAPSLLGCNGPVPGALGL